MFVLWFSNGLVRITPFEFPEMGMQKYRDFVFFPEASR
jgi:hypothetical protein